LLLAFDTDELFRRSADDLIEGMVFLAGREGGGWILAFSSAAAILFEERAGGHSLIRCARESFAW
jgi:hypothetical protein